MQKKIAGILGGMGPEATVDFIKKVIDKTNAKIDQDHIQMLIDHNPKVPNRHAAINGEGENIGPHLAKMALGLERAGADFLVMVCNTAHAFQADIQASVTIPFVSIVDEEILKLKSQYRWISRELSPKVKNYAALLQSFSDLCCSGFSKTCLT